MRSIHFIASYPRSGNTWVRSFLFALLRERGDIPKAASFLDIDRYMPWDIRHYADVFGKPAGEFKPLHLLALRPEIHRWIAETWPAPPIVKTHTLFGAVRGNPLFATDVMQGAVYVVRNPLDAIPSLANFLGVTIDEAISIASTPLYKNQNRAQSPELWGSWSQNVASWATVTGALIIRYEDLRANPKRTFGKICSDIGINAKQVQIDRSIDAVRIGEMKRKFAVGEFVPPRGRHRPRVLGDGVYVPYWHKITPSQCAKIIDAHGEVMRRFNYLTDEAVAFSRD